MALRVSKFGGWRSTLRPRSNLLRSLSDKFLSSETVDAGKDHLLVCIVKSVESMKELFLATEFVLKEMDVVNEEHIHIAVFILKVLSGFIVNGLDELIGKFLGGDADDFHFWALNPNPIAYGLHQVGFT